MFLPGLGSLVAGKTVPGVIQLMMFLIGVPLCFALVGFPIIATAWIWGLATGFTALAEAKQAAAYQQAHGDPRFPHR
jgi:TM2 domain-containing membrane protein YozV